MLTIVIADDYPAVLAALVKLLDETGICRILASATNGDEALQAVLVHRPDIALLDISMPVLDGLSVARKLKVQAPGTKIIFVSNEGVGYVQAAFDAGGAGFVQKSMAAEDLANAITKVAAGGWFVSETMRYHQNREE